MGGRQNWMRPGHRQCLPDKRLDVVQMVAREALGGGRGALGLAPLDSDGGAWAMMLTQHVIDT